MYDIHFRDAALRLYNKVMNMSKVSKLLDISIASISRWVRQVTPKKRECKPRKVTSVIVNFIEEQFKINPLFICQEIAEQIESKFNVHISIETIRLMCKKLGLSFKVLRLRLAKPSDEKVENFKHQLREAIESNLPVVSIDESGFDQRLQTRRGFCPKGRETTCIFSPKCKKHVRYNLLLGISNHGEKHEHIVDCTCKRREASDENIFANYILNLPFISGSTLLLDNVSFHKTQTVRQAAITKGYKLLFVPPYSPEYNPIELAFGMLKNMFYKKRFKPEYNHNKQQIHNLTSIVKESNILNFFSHVYKLIY